MTTLSSSAYQDLVHHAEALTRERVNGHICPKVLRLDDGSILKLFRLKRLFTSARLRPHTVRFQRNAVVLQSLNVPTVELIATYRIPSIARTAVHYRPLAGMTIRDHCEANALSAPLARELGLFYHDLHARGVYFRSIHFNNIVLTPKLGLGLIDVADMRYRKRSLPLSLRVRNLRHLFREASDVAHMAPVRSFFINAYRDAADLPPREAEHFGTCFERYFRGHRLSGADREQRTRP
jgi:hypothetical protein